MDFVIMQKQGDAVILRGTNTGTYYMAGKTDNGWYVFKKRQFGEDWISFPRAKFEPNVVQELGLDSR